MGGSYGGYAVMVAVTEFPNLFAAGVNLYGMVNFETFFEHTEPWMAAISGTEYGDPETERNLLQRLSPIHKLDRVKTPLLVQHGANDTNGLATTAAQPRRSRIGYLDSALGAEIARRMKGTKRGREL